MELNDDTKQKLARALRAKAQPVKYQNRYASAEDAIRADYYEALEQIYGPEAIYGDDEGIESHPYFSHRGGSYKRHFHCWN